MSGKDPAIKLFGRTITLPEIVPEPARLESRLDDSAGSTNAPLDDCIVQRRSSSPISLAEGSDLDRGGVEQDSTMDPQDGTGEGSAEEDGDELVISNESIEPQGKKLKASSVDDMASSAKAEEEQNESSESQNKTPKKPDKILPCPRCNSLDTKFCYYNNYNVNQPRHFCKNCHRYWTAGGTMRNVPVGAGRRKNKNSASHCRLETLQNGHEDLPNGSHSTLKACDISLASSLDTPIFNSMASGRNIAEKTVQDGDNHKNGFHAEGLGVSINGDNHSVHSSITMTSSKDEDTDKRLSDNLVFDSPSIPRQMAWFSGAPWPYPWNTIQVPSPILPAGCCPVGFSMPFYPAAPFWGCCKPGDGNVPWLNSPPAFRNDTSGPNCLTVRKHSRDDSMTELSNSEKDEPLNGSQPGKCLWVPKTLRIMDPEEAAKSSIWATLGITEDKVDSAVGNGLLKAFQSKRDEKTHALESSPLFQANPAALSRS